MRETRSTIDRGATLVIGFTGLQERKKKNSLSSYICTLLIAQNRENDDKHASKLVQACEMTLST